MTSKPRRAAKAQANLKPKTADLFLTDEQTVKLEAERTQAQRRAQAQRAKASRERQRQYAKEREREEQQYQRRRRGLSDHDRAFEDRVNRLINQIMNGGAK